MMFRGRELGVLVSEVWGLVACALRGGGPERRQSRVTTAAILSATLVGPLMPAAAHGEPIVVSWPGFAYAQNFDSMTIYHDVPPGWRFAETGSAANGDYSVGDGSANAGGVYDFGRAGSPERALGILPSGALSGVIGVDFLNEAGVTITAVSIAFTTEQWRAGTDFGANVLAFEYAVYSGDIAAATWIPLSQFDTAAVDVIGEQNTALDGNTRATAVDGAITGLVWSDGQTLGLRWTGLNRAGFDDGLAVDSFRLDLAGTSTPGENTGGVPEPQMWAMLIVGFAAAGCLLRRRTAPPRLGRP